MYFYYTEPKLSPRSHLESCNLDNIPHILPIPFRTSRSHLLFFLFFLKLHILTEIHLAHCFALFVFKNKKTNWVVLLFPDNRTHHHAYHTQTHRSSNKDLPFLFFNEKKTEAKLIKRPKSTYCKA